MNKTEREKQRLAGLAVGVLAVEWSVDETGDHDEAVEGFLGYAVAREAEGRVTLERITALCGTGKPCLVGALAREALSPFDSRLPVDGFDRVTEEAARVDSAPILATHFQIDSPLTVGQLRAFIGAAYLQRASYPTADLTNMYMPLDI